MNDSAFFLEIMRDAERNGWNDSHIEAAKILAKPVQTNPRESNQSFLPWAMGGFLLGNMFGD